MSWKTFLAITSHGINYKLIKSFVYFPKNSIEQRKITPIFKRLSLTKDGNSGK